MEPLSLLWLFFVLASLQPTVARQILIVQRRRALAEISRERKATVITRSPWMHAPMRSA